VGRIIQHHNLGALHMSCRQAALKDYDPKVYGRHSSCSGRILAVLSHHFVQLIC
jgi:hypothetical protein